MAIHPTDTTLNFKMTECKTIREKRSLILADCPDKRHFGIEFRQTRIIIKIEKKIKMTTDTIELQRKMYTDQRTYM